MDQSLMILVSVRNIHTISYSILKILNFLFSLNGSSTHLLIVTVELFVFFGHILSLFSRIWNDRFMFAKINSTRSVSYSHYDPWNRETIWFKFYFLRIKSISNKNRHSLFSIPYLTISWCDSSIVLVFLSFFFSSFG